jgi:hypothetical protein
MCRALKVLCAAADRERLGELKRASVGARWELTGGAASLEELHRQIGEFEPDVVVVDAALGPEALGVVRAVRRTARLVSLGSLPGADAEAAELDDVRAAILGLPRPGGPVRT